LEVNFNENLSFHLNKNIAQGKEAGRLLFDFDAVNITEDDCEQRFQSVSLSFQHLTWTDDGRARFTTAVVWHEVEQGAILIFAHISYLIPEYLPRERLGEDLYAATKSAIPTCH